MTGKMHMIPAVPKVMAKKRVAAYARVSSGKDAMLHSLSAQVSYYSRLIQEHQNWVYCGVYADEALTGTKDEREEFQRMLSDSRNGKLDMIITKSISRFARNTVTLLNTIRELKELNVDVYFEEQNIHSISGDGELMLTILASYAQEESLSASENQKWRIHKLFEQGKLPMNTNRIYGYTREKDGSFVIVPHEADIVRKIYSDFLDGCGIYKIAKMLNDKAIPTETGEKWTDNKVRYILSSERYIGDLLLQKKFIADHLTKRVQRNRGELPKYYVEESHEPIISRDTFNKVQDEFKIRSAKHYRKRPQTPYPFTSLIKCDICGKNYRRKVTAARVVWICSTFNKYGRASCASKQIPEDTLIDTICSVLGMSELGETELRNRINYITACAGNKLVYHFTNGETKEIFWKDISRSESRTTDMKEAARKKAIEGRKKNAEDYNDSGYKE